MSLPPRTAVPESSPAIVEADAAVVAVEPAQLDHHPVAVFVASLSPGSRRTMLSALKIVATIVSPDSDAMTFPWASLDYAHTAAIRTRLAESFAPATANKIRVSDTFSGCMAATSVWSTEEPGAMLASRRVAIDLDVRGS